MDRSSSLSQTVRKPNGTHNAFEDRNCVFRFNSISLRIGWGFENFVASVILIYLCTFSLLEAWSKELAELVIKRRLSDLKRKFRRKFQSISTILAIEQCKMLQIQRKSWIFIERSEDSWIFIPNFIYKWRRNKIRISKCHIKHKKAWGISSFDRIDNRKPSNHW